MQSPDVNVLVYASREEATDHVRYRRWLEELLTSGESFAVSELVLSGFLRLVTDGRIFRPATPRPIALAFAQTVRNHPRCVVLRPMEQHWEIFVRLCETTAATGKLVADAYQAALAIEHRCEWVTNDRDFARFPGLRWRHPFL
ncbi:MAG: type II toxin-antitoxin system VapC family toxin [Chthoniobacterales bacterium]